MKTINVAIIGKGRIGTELYRKIISKNWNVKFILDIDGFYKNLSEKMNPPKDCYEELDIAFLAIPTLDDGFTAFNHIQSFLKRGIPIVTCEKGAFSNYFSELMDWKNNIGYSATVGGGTRMLRYMEEKINQKTKKIYAIINGTLNYIFNEVSEGKGIKEVAEETKKLGYAEPGARSALEIINKEMVDVAMKSSILFNMCKFTPIPIRAKDIQIRKISEFEFEELIKEAKNRRCIVSITKEDNEEDVIGGFKHRVDGWIISIGFKRIDKNPIFSELITKGVDNALIICNGKYNYRLSGPGAGAEPTTESMIKDAEDLLA
jgi:aspartokinase/homoserine dehydrogenase 1